MDHENITKGILTGIINRYIGEIGADPGRSIRKLLDMAELTSDGPTQKICYQMMQKMAENQSSPYYEMIRHMVTSLPPETVSKFGINLGHNAWTFSSGHVRQISANRDISIPWAVLIDRSSAPDRISFSEITDLVGRGRAVDIFGWLIFCSDDLDEWEEYTELFQKHDDCVFGLCVSPRALRDDLLEEISGIHNLMILLDTGHEEWQEWMEKLSRSGCLYSAFRTIRTADDAADVTSGEWFEETAPFYPLLGFTCTADDCPEQAADAVQRYMWQTRLDQVYPVLPCDLISDFLIISRLVSHREVLYRVETDGRVSEGDGLRFRPGPMRCGDLFGLLPSAQ